MAKTRAAVASFAATGTESNEINLYGATRIGFYIPAGLDSVTLKFKSAIAKGGTYLPVYDSAGEVSLTVAASRYVIWVVPIALAWTKLVVTAQDPALDITLVIHE